jgi:hypothetical protein
MFPRQIAPRSENRMLALEDDCPDNSHLPGTGQQLQRPITGLAPLIGFRLNNKSINRLVSINDKSYYQCLIELIDN